jgi:hypothetical protein
VRWSIASTRACFESERLGLAESRRASFPVFLRRAAAARRAGLSRAGSAPRPAPLLSSTSSSALPLATPMAARPRVVMRSAKGPLPSSRCQIGSAPRAGISAFKPWVRRVPTTLSAAPLRLGASLMAPSSRYAAADSSTSWASVRLFGDSFFGDIVGILHSVCGGVSRRHHRSPARAQKPAGQDPMRALGALRRPEQ